MAPSAPNRKRKAITHDSSEAEEVILSDGGSDLELSKINGALSYSDEEDQSSGEEAWLDSEDEDTDITEEEKDDEVGGVDLKRGSQGSNGHSNSDEMLAAMDPEDEANYTITTDANGNPRYIYKAIDPVYDSDDSDAPAVNNTIGNIPMSFYDSYPHIGYDINGRKISRPATGEALDTLLDTIDIPKGWTGLTDPATGKPLQLSQEELEVLKRIQLNEVPDGYDPYPETIEYFSGKLEIMALSAAPEPKRRFIPSKHEAIRVMKIVKAIREGRIMPYKPPSEEDEEDQDVKRYDIWANEAPQIDHPMNIPAPKLPPPGYDESYHPPAEYLPDEVEKKAWVDMDEEDRRKEYLPTNHDSLRKVPGYENFVKEKFERCLDLYLAPRVRRNKLNIDPESLLPKLPSPEELRPFPTTCATIFRGHEGRVRSLAIDPLGNLLASGGDDGTVRLWELLTGRQVWSVMLSKGEAVNVVRWRPTPNVSILAAASGDDIYLIVPPTNDPEVEMASRQVLDAGWGHAATNSQASNGKVEGPAKWTRPGTRLEDSGTFVQISLKHTVKSLTWHRRGDHLSSVSPTATTRAVAIHTISKHLTQLPFRRLKGLAQCAAFHPTKPHFFVATQRSIRIYDLAAQTLVSTLQPGARWLSSLAIHPSGAHLLAGAYDRRLLWHDLELSPRPYRTLRYHERAIRAVRFHPGGLPLFADASDDGTVQVFHARVVGDAMENVAIVPLKVLRGHRVRGALGVLDVEWHPREPWCVSAGADGTCRLWM